MSAPQPWTEDQKALLRKLWPDTTLSLAEIGRRCGHQGKGAARRQGVDVLGLPQLDRQHYAPPRPGAVGHRGLGGPADRSWEHPIVAELSTVAEWAVAQKIRFRGWDDLPAVNEARDRKALPRFQKPLRCHMGRAA